MEPVTVVAAPDSAADEPPSPARTEHSIIYCGDPAQLQSFLATIGQREFFHPSIDVKHSPIAGRGLFASALIRRGELISYEDPRDYLILNRDQVERMSAEDQDFWWHFCYQVGDDAWMGPRSRDVVGRKKTFFENHSCDPTTWFVDDITMTARRDIHAGEEITYDYSTTESFIDPEMETVTCRCESPICRGRLFPTDWQRAELQERYGPHWMSYLCEKIAVHRVALARQEASSASDSETSSSGSSSDGDEAESPRSVSPSLGAPGSSFLKQQPHRGFRATWSEAASYPGHVEQPATHHHHHRHHHHQQQQHPNPLVEEHADTGYY